MTEIRARVEKIVKNALVTQGGSGAIVSAPLTPGYSTLVDRPATTSLRPPPPAASRAPPRASPATTPDVPAGPAAAGMRSRPP